MSRLRLRVPKGHADAVRYLDEVESDALAEIEEARARVYFNARLEGQFETALAAGRISRKRALRLVRGLNHRLGCPMRWRDGLDCTSTYQADE